MMYCLFASQSCCAEYRNKFEQVQDILDGGSSWIRGVGVAVGVFGFEGGGGSEKLSDTRGFVQTSMHIRV